jgi:hypothetical protein
LLLLLRDESFDECVNTPKRRTKKNVIIIFMTEKK